MNDHVDMGQFIAARSDQLNADDLLDGPRTITITKVTASPDAAEQPVSVHYEGDAGKPFKPCKTVRRIMVGVWGREAAKYVGRSMTLYRDPTVAFGGMQVGGLRVSHMSHIDEKKTVALQVTRGRKAPYSVLPLKMDAPATQHNQIATDNGATLARLETLAKPGNIDAVGAEWQSIGADARKALAEHLPRLKAACEQSAPPAEDVPFDNAGGAPASDPSAEKSDAEKAVDKVISEADAATTPAAIEKIIKAAESHKPFMPEDLQLRLEIAFDKNRNRLAAGAEA